MTNENNRFMVIIPQKISNICYFISLSTSVYFLRSLLVTTSQFKNCSPLFYVD